MSADEMLTEVLARRRRADYRGARDVALRAVSDPDRGSASSAAPLLLLELGRLHEEFGAYDDAEATLRDLALAPDPVLRTRALTRLVAVHRGQGRPGAAAESARGAVATGEQATPMPAAVLCEALVMAAPAEHDVAGPAAAEALVNRAEAAVRQCPQGAEGDTSRALVLGALGAHHRRVGRLQEAEPVLREALALAEATFGPSSLEVANVLNELGVTFKFSGRFDEAEPIYNRCLTILVAAFGTEEHPDVATVYHNLGGLAHARGAFAEAEPYARRSVAISERFLGSGHLKVAADRAALASILDALGHHDEAGTLLREALDVFERAYGPEHHEVAVTLNNLAAIAQRRGDVDEAEALYRRALSIKEKTLGALSSETGYTLNNLAVLRRKRGDQKEAEELYRRALAAFDAALEPTHPTIAVTLANYAALLESMGRGEEAAALRLRAEKLSGPDDSSSHR